MKLYVGITDYDWFKLHTSKLVVDEVNFWRPSSQLEFKALAWGEPFLFKLHAPRNFIVGGGFFTKFLRLPVSLAWQTFGEANGARTLDEVRIRIAKYRKHPIAPNEDPVIGCIHVRHASACRTDSPDSSRDTSSPRRALLLC